MYRHNQRQLEFENFYLPFGGKLRSDNRWVKLAKFIPWEEEAPSDEDDDPPNSGSSGNENENSGKLLVDATCTPADVTFPTDLKILNPAREKSEEIIDVLHRPYKGAMKKPRTYRIKARRQFLVVAKSKNVSKNKLRKAIRKQLGYLGRNLKTIAKLSSKSSLLLLSKRQYRNLLVIQEVYWQLGTFYPTSSRGCLRT